MLICVLLGKRNSNLSTKVTVSTLRSKTNSSQKEAYRAKEISVACEKGFEKQDRN